MTRDRIEALDILRVIGIFFVMLIHSSVDEHAESSLPIFLLKEFLASGAVPVFFILSGYLGAKSLQTPTLTFQNFARSKINTLVIPYLFWNLLALALVSAVKTAELTSYLRGEGAYFDVEPTLPSISCAIFGIGRSPIVYQFWFLRDLIVVTFIAFIICRSLPRIPLLPWFLFFIPLPMSSTLGYYLLGCYLNRYLPPEGFPKLHPSLLFSLLWCGMGIGVFAGLINISYPIQQLGSACFILTISIAISKTRWKQRLAALGPATFFVYATHEPLQTIFAKTWHFLNIPHHGELFFFLLIPSVVFIICASIYSALLNVSPKIILIATGHREHPNKQE